MAASESGPSARGIAQPDGSLSTGCVTKFGHYIRVVFLKLINIIEELGHHFN